jgi:hypothetical protein
MLISPPAPVTTPQSQAEQHSPQLPVSGQQRSPVPHCLSSCWQAPEPSQVSVVQAFPSSQSACARQATQPRSLSQTVPVVQFASFGTWLHEPEPLQVSSVHSTPSEQLALSQHSRQVVPPQHNWPLGQPVYVHWPLSQVTVWQARGAQSEGAPHVPLGTQPFAPSQR